VRKATAFRGRADKTARPYRSLRHATLENVPVEHFQQANVTIDFCGKIGTKAAMHKDSQKLCCLLYQGKPEIRRKKL
jgi:hypothetical protein